MKITVNCKPFEWINETISYDEIVSLAGEQGKYLTITFFAKGKDKWTTHQGILCHGESVPVWDNMHITCIYTGNA